MNVSRRWFLGGAASFGTFAGLANPLHLQTSKLPNTQTSKLPNTQTSKLPNTQTPKPPNTQTSKHPNTQTPKPPKLKFGVISDPHIAADVGGIMPSHDTRYLEKAFRRFRALGANAVVICGDIGDRGLTEELEAFQQAWERVFPSGCGVERIVVSGNHDWEGFKYGTNVQRVYPDERERARHVLKTDMPGNWERILHEKYEPVFRKVVNGYTFIGQHWEDPYYRRLPDFMAAHGAEIDPNKPFFYVQHAHPKDTCFGPWADWDEGATTECLSRYPNAVAFSGHSHLSMLDERAFWQGAFTSVGAASLRYGSICKREFADRGGLEGPSHFFTNRTALFVTVYDDAIVYSRHDYEHDLAIGEDWVQPLPQSSNRRIVESPEPTTKLPNFQTSKLPNSQTSKLPNSQTSSTAAPQFSSGADLVTERTPEGLSLTIPAAMPDVRARAYVFEVEVAGAEGQRLFKRVVANGYNCSERDPEAVAATKLTVPAAELPKGALSVSVAPVNCFGRRGRALVRDIA